MRGVFDEREREPVQTVRDTELTLGSGALLAIGFGLIALCALCFGLGYEFGHRSAPASLAVLSKPAALPAESNSHAKPSATQQPGQTNPPQPVDASQLPAGVTAVPSALPGAATQTPAPAAQPGTTSSAAEIRPALTPAVETSQSGQPAAVAQSAVHPAFASTTQPVATPAGSLMVQIAAVSNAEDASVLTNALRKRGYTVTERREPADNLIHVRVGPFATPAEANAWRMKLLNDGYNAIVQQ